MWKSLLITWLWFSSSLTVANPLLITGQVEAVHAQYFGVPELDNWLVKIHWMEEEGKKVKANDIVVVFETSNIATEIEQLETSLRKTQSESEIKMLELQLSVKEAQSEYEKAKLHWAKAKVDARMPESQASQYQYARNQFEVSKAKNVMQAKLKALAVKKAELETENSINQLSVQSAEKDLERKTKQMEGMSLRATESGAVMYVEHPWNGTKIRAGDTVQRGFTVLQIPSTDALKVTAWLNEVDIAWVTTGQPVALTVDALPELTIEGKVHRISSHAEVREQWGEAAYFKMNIEIPQNISGLMPGMSTLATVDRQVKQ
jgi:multidrug resistance efflux pump